MNHKSHCRESGGVVLAPPLWGQRFQKGAITIKILLVICSNMHFVT